MEEEHLLGGVKSPYFKRGKYNSLKAAGYGIYATNRRLFGVNTSSEFVKQVYGSLLRGPVFWGTLGLVRTPVKVADNSKTIEELERSRDFEIPKNHIVSMELKKANHFRGGYLRIEVMGECLNEYP